MIKITEKQLVSLHACSEVIAWFLNQKKRSLKLIVSALLKDNHFDYARWLLKKLLTKEQNQLWAISSAKSVLHIFESKRPNDFRPREAIQGAEDYLAGKITTDQLRTLRQAAYAKARKAKEIEVCNFALKLLGEIK